MIQTDDAHRKLESTGLHDERIAPDSGFEHWNLRLDTSAKSVSEAARIQEAIGGGSARSSCFKLQCRRRPQRQGLPLVAEVEAEAAHSCNLIRRRFCTNTGNRYRRGGGFFVFKTRKWYNREALPFLMKNYKRKRSHGTNKLRS